MWRGWLSDIQKGSNELLGDITNTLKGLISEEEENKEEEEEERKKARAQLPWLFPSPSSLPSYSPLIHEQLHLLILSLSHEKETFVKDPPPSVVFPFELDDFLPIASLLLSADDTLSRKRFLYVPRYVREWRFWRNYFYRVAKIFEQHQIDFALYSPTASKSPHPLLLSSSPPPLPSLPSNQSPPSALTHHPISDHHHREIDQKEEEEGDQREGENEEGSGGGMDDEIIIECGDDDLMDFTSLQFGDDGDHLLLDGDGGDDDGGGGPLTPLL